STRNSATCRRWRMACGSTGDSRRLMCWNGTSAEPICRSGFISAVLLWLCIPGGHSSDLAAAAPEHLNPEIAHRAFLFFRDETDPRTGLTKDRARLNGSDTYTVASI